MSAQHLTTDELADAAEGLLDPERAAFAESHIADCPDCHAQSDALRAVSATLHAEPASAMPEAVAAVRARNPQPGDVFILNDPYAGGSHLPDLTLVQVVEMRYFGGYSEQEIAEFQGVDERTVRRRWAKARAWLYVALGGKDVPPAT